MKKLLALLLVLLMLLSLAACAEIDGDTVRDIVDIARELSQLADSSGESAPAEETPPAQAAEESAPAEETPAAQPAEESAPAEEPAAEEEKIPDENGVYDSKDEVAAYIHAYGHLPSNYISKKQAEKLGWTGGSLEPYAPGKCIGGSYFGNYESLLPEKKGREYTECDIDTMGKSSRGAKRIVFSNDGLIYYTDDHYGSFTLLYGEE